MTNFQAYMAEVEAGHYIPSNVVSEPLIACDA